MIRKFGKWVALATGTLASIGVLAVPFAAEQGVRVIAGQSSWTAHSLEDAIQQVKTRNHIARLTGHLSLSAKCRIVAIFLGPIRLEVDGSRIPPDRKRNAVEVFTVPSGSHRIDLLCNPPEFGRKPRLVWTRDLAVPASAPGRLFVNAPDRTSQWAATLVQMLRIGFILIVAGGLVYLFFVLIVRLESSSSVTPFLQLLSIRDRLFLIPLFLAPMMLIRVGGITYQLEEGLHPDERVIEQTAGRFQSEGLKPRTHFWSTGFQYMSASLECTIRWIFERVPPAHLIPRLLSAFFSWLSCLAIFSIGARLYSPRHGVIAAVLMGFSLLPVEMSHFGIIEPSMVFFVLLAYRLLLELSKNSPRRMFLVAGAAAGLAMGLKQTAAVILVPFAAHFLLFCVQPRGIKQNLENAGCWFLAAAAGYIFLCPYTLLDFGEFLKWQAWQLRAQQGIGHPAHYFAGRMSEWGSVSLIVDQLTRGMGIPMLIAAMFGIPLVLKQAGKASVSCISLTLVYFTILCLSRTPPHHYVLLLCPFLALLAAFAAVATVSRTFLQGIAVLLLLVPTIAGTVTLTRIRQGVDTRRQAERWCNANLPPRSRIQFETFGPRFLIPIFEANRVPLFHRPRWQFVKTERPGYYVYDSITAGILENRDSVFPKESQWFRDLRKHGKVVKEFSGDSFGLYNPDILIFQIQPTLKQEKNL